MSWLRIAQPLTKLLRRTSPFSRTPPPRPEPPPPGYSLIADRRQILTSAWSKRALYAAIAVAFLLHLLVLVPFLVRPAPNPAEAVRELGMEDGAPEHLNVSVISEADLKRLSSDPFHQEAPPSPAAADTPAPPPGTASGSRAAATSRERSECGFFCR